MRFSIYGHYEFDIVREGDTWRVFNLDAGKRVLVNDVVIPTEVQADEIPLFWACGITPQSVVLDARPSLCITHTPGHMLVTDLTNASLAQS